MRKKQKKQLAIGIILIVALILFGLNNPFSIGLNGLEISKGSSSLYQYGKYDTYVEELTNRYQFVGESKSTLKTESSTFSFDVVNLGDVETGDIGLDGKVRSSGMCGNIYYYWVDVYKDGRLIDSIGSEWFTSKDILSRPKGVLVDLRTCAGTEEGCNGCTIAQKRWENSITNGIIADSRGGIKKGYADDGTIYPGELPKGVPGVNVYFGASTWSVSAGNYGRRVKIINKFDLVYPEDSLKIELKDSSKLGNEVNIKLNAYSKINGKAKIELELIAEGLFEKTLKQTKEITINKGDNNIDFNFVTDKDLSELSIQPNIKLYVPTSGFGHLNADESVNLAVSNTKKVSQFSGIKIQDYSLGSVKLETGKEIPIEPVSPEPTGWFSWVIKLNEWIKNLFKKIFGL